jgi:hypothetical protein
VTILWLCGATAVGKSTVGWQLYRQCNLSGVHTAFLDLDQIGFLRPAPADDPLNHRLKAANLASIWPAYSAAGARRLVIVGPLRDPADVAAYTAAGIIRLCRLHAGRRQLTERVLLRGQGHGPQIGGDELTGQPAAVLAEVADRAAADALALEAAGIGDMRIDTDDRSVADIAHEIFCRWSVT